MNTLNPYILYTITTSVTGTGCRAFLYLDEAAAQADGAKFVAEKPAEATSAEFMVLPLEGPFIS